MNVEDAKPSAASPVAPDKAMGADESPRGIVVGEPGILLRLIKNQKVAFLVVGGVNTVLSTLLFVALELTFGQYVSSPVVLFAAWLMSLVAVFFVYRKLVFRVKGHVLLDLGRFALVNLTSLLINMALLFLIADILGYPRIPSQIVITCCTVFINYFGHKYFSFRRPPPEGDAAAVAADQKKAL
ncbi:GtrA family protein [Arthrobacter cheniae]|nr:GtrA family protein [Arthrobacter cheniae]